MDSDWVAKILGDAQLRLMGHGQRLDDANLGLGFSLDALAAVAGEGGPTGPVLFKGALLQTP